MKDRIKGLSAIFKTIQGIEAAFEDESSGVIATMIAGRATSNEYMPVNTGHMRNNTYAAKIAGKYVVRTDTNYAYKQYYGNLYHFKTGKIYKSISRSNTGSFTAEELRPHFGSALYNYVYQKKYKALKDAMLLHKSKPMWFHKAAHAVIKPATNSIKKAFTRIARLKARSGTYYTR